MKFLHLGDLHLGRTLGDYDLIKDQQHILGRVLEIAEEEDADAVLIAGDIYDKAIPSEAAVRLLDSFLSRLCSAGIKTFMISGNHDSDERLNFGSWVFESRSVYISAVFDGKLTHHEITDSGQAVHVYMLPFVKASQVRHYYPDAKIETYEDAVRTVIENAGIDRSACNILIAHQFVSGKGEDPALGGSEGVGTQSVGLVEKIGYGCFDAFDYVALGHIHSPQQVGRSEVRYAGSPLKYSLSEVNNEKSAPVVTVGGKGDVSIKLVPLEPKRDLRHIRGTMKELIDAKDEKTAEDFIYATLTDEDIINDAMGIMRLTYPNTVKIDYDNSHTKAIEQVDISNIAKNRSFTDLVSDFYKMVYGCEITEEEMDVMRMAAREAGVIDEAG